MWISVVIPSLGRRNVLHETVLSLDRQSRKADEILLSVVDPEQDVLPETLEIEGVRLVSGRKGLTCQRNTAINSVHPECELICFFDDDVELQPNYLGNCCQFMSEHPEVVGMSGEFIANGAATGEISRREALRMVQSCAEPVGEVRSRVGLYGCNMSVRRSIAQTLQFDERLRNYSLYEDLDFGLRCAERGPVVTALRCQLVHLHTQVSRVSTKPFGYACIMNPFYLWRKGTLSIWRFVYMTIISLVANAVGIIVVRHGIMRKMRCEMLIGSMLGFRDICIYGAVPERMESI